MAKCNWEPFFTEFTDKMLEYKDIEKRPELLKKIGIAFSQAKYEAPKCGSSNNGKELTLDDDIQNLDPFSILMFIVRGGEKIKNICVQIEQVFQMKNHFPVNNYDSKGIPIPKTRSKEFCLTWYFETPKKDNDASIEYLWNLFEAAVNLRKNYSKTTKDMFTSLYIQFETYIPKYWKVSSISDILFLIAPNTLFGLNSKSVSYITYCFPLLKNDAESAKYSFKNGSDYLTVCEKLKANLENSGETLLDFYYDSYYFFKYLENATRDFLYSNGYKSEIENPNNVYNYSKIGDSNHKGEFWMFPNNSLLEVHTTWFMALNDWINSIIYFIKIPPETFSEDQIFVQSNGQSEAIFKLVGGKFIDLRGRKHCPKPMEITANLITKYDVRLDLGKKYIDVSKKASNQLNTTSNQKHTITLTLFHPAIQDAPDVDASSESSVSVKPKKPGIHDSTDSAKKEQTGKSGADLIFNHLNDKKEFLGEKIDGEIKRYDEGAERNDNIGYDVSFKLENGKMIYADFKSSAGPNKKGADFIISSNEYDTMLEKEKECEGSYYILFIDNISDESAEKNIRAIKGSDFADKVIPASYNVNLIDSDKN